MHLSTAIQSSINYSIIVSRRLNCQSAASRLKRTYTTLLTLIVALAHFFVIARLTCGPHFLDAGG